MNKVLLPKMFNGSRYAERLPIGTGSGAARTSSTTRCKRFYRDWYRPDLMAVVAVGDIEPARSRAAGQAPFRQAEKSGQAAPARLRDHPGALGDRSGGHHRQGSEQQLAADPLPGAGIDRAAAPLAPTAKSWSKALFAQHAQPAHAGTVAAGRPALHRRQQQHQPPDARATNPTPRSRRSAKAAPRRPSTRWCRKTNARASSASPPAELDRAKKNLMRFYERAYNERDKTDSASYVGEYVRNFLEQESIPGIENEYRYVQETGARASPSTKSTATRATPFPTARPSWWSTWATPTATRRCPPARELLASVSNAEKDRGARARRKGGGGQPDGPAAASRQHRQRIARRGARADPADAVERRQGDPQADRLPQRPGANERGALRRPDAVRRSRRPQLRATPARSSPAWA